MHEMTKLELKNWVDMQVDACIEEKKHEKFSSEIYVEARDWIKVGGGIKLMAEAVGCGIEEINFGAGGKRYCFKYRGIDFESYSE